MENKQSPCEIALKKHQIQGSLPPPSFCTVAKTYLMIYIVHRVTQAGTVEFHLIGNMGYFLSELECELVVSSPDTWELLRWL